MDSFTPGPVAVPCHLMVNDFSVLCEDYVCSAEATYFLSVIGSREAIRAVRALLVKGERGVLRQGQDAKRVLMSDASKLLTHKLVPGRHVGLIISARLQTGQALVVPDETQLPGAFRSAFEKMSEVPTHPAWQAWLWQKAAELEVVTPLETRLRQAYLIGELAPLEHALRLALRGGELCA